MKRIFLTFFSIGGLMSGALLAVGETGAGTPPNDLTEEWVNANLLRVRVGGKWEEVPMIPLADHLCESGRSLFKRYCTDQVLTPASN